MDTRRYIYRGTGEDTLTGDLSPQQLRDAIKAHEGDGYPAPLTYNQVGEHGTQAGAAQHRRRGETPCGSCAAAVRWADSQRRAVTA
jgi:hypothetical protein